MAVEIETIMDIANEIFKPSYTKMMEFRKSLESKFDDSKSIYSHHSKDSDSVHISEIDTLSVFDIHSEKHKLQIESDIEDYKFKLSKLRICEEVYLPIDLGKHEIFTIQFDISFDFINGTKYIFALYPSEHDRRYCYLFNNKLNIFDLTYDKDIEFNKKYNIQLKYDKGTLSVFINNEIQGTINMRFTDASHFLFGCIPRGEFVRTLSYEEVYRHHCIKNATVTDFYFM